MDGKKLNSFKAFTSIVFTILNAASNCC